MPSHLALLRILTLAAVATGCTAVKASYHVSTADQAVAEARKYGAADSAVYEYTMSVRYLEESKEKLGFSHYRASEQLARKSAEWADKAVISVQEHKRVDGGPGIEDRPDAPPPPPPQPVQPPVPDPVTGLAPVPGQPSTVVFPEPTVEVDQFGIPIVTPDTPATPWNTPAPAPVPVPEPAPVDPFAEPVEGEP